MDNSTETADSSAIETADSYTVSDLAGTWQINGEKTQAANERSLAEEFGTGIHLGNEMLLSEHGDFSYYVSINQGGKGTWNLDGTVITADYTTYEPDVRKEQLTMTLEAGDKGELLIKMNYTDGYYSVLESAGKARVKYLLRGIRHTPIMILSKRSLWNLQRRRKGLSEAVL